MTALPLRTTDIPCSENPIFSLHQPREGPDDVPSDMHVVQQQEVGTVVCAATGSKDLDSCVTC